MESAEQQLDGFIDKYTPEIAAQARDVLGRLRARIPGALLLVYDNYNALAIGFSSTDRTSDGVLSVALYPRWVTLFFLRGVRLADPHGLLAGSGSHVRHIRLAGPEDLDDPRVDALIAAALGQSIPPFDAARPQRLIIKSVSEKQRPRRPNV